MPVAYIHTSALCGELSKKREKSDEYTLRKNTVIRQLAKEFLVHKEK